MSTPLSISEFEKSAYSSDYSFPLSDIYGLIYVWHLLIGSRKYNNDLLMASVMVVLDTNNTLFSSHLYIPQKVGQG